MLLDIDWLKKNHQMIHYFGLGFIQLKVTDTIRLHFYTVELPKIVDDEEIHNHRYSFTSRIMKGSMYNYLYEVVPGLGYEKVPETCNPNIEVPDDVKKEACTFRYCGYQLMTKGSQYCIEHHQFHKVKATHCITLLIRGPYEKQYAEVIRPFGAKAVCPFSVKLPETRLWEVVDSMSRSEDA